MASSLSLQIVSIGRCGSKFCRHLPDAIMMTSGERGEFFKPDCRQSL
jgi:hypothetical protein